MEQHLKNMKKLLIEIQKDKSGKLLKETKETNNRINLTELAEEILMEYDNSYREYASEKENRIKYSLNNWTGDDGAWDRQKYENMGDYEERVTKADFRLDALKEYIKKEVGEAWKEFLKVEGIKNLDNDSKTEIVKTMSDKLGQIARKLLETLSVYPFEWDFYDNNLSKGLSKL
jgi:hypothetical protein